MNIEAVEAHFKSLGKQIPSFCAVKIRAEQIGREKGLLEKGEKIYCGFALTCNGLRCLLAEQEPPVRSTIRIPILQTDNIEPQSNLNQFYSRLEKHRDLVSQRK